MVILPSEEVKEKLKKSNASELSCHICEGYEDEMRDTVLDEKFLGTIENPSEMHPETFVHCAIASFSSLRYCFSI